MLKKNISNQNVVLKVYIKIQSICLKVEIPKDSKLNKNNVICSNYNNVYPIDIIL